MLYVYILRSLDDPERYYVGITSNLRDRLQRHNSGQVLHTSRYAPWAIKTYIAFGDKEQAIAFEKYLKSPSGGRSRKSGCKFVSLAMNHGAAIQRGLNFHAIAAASAGR
jgi:putative endonuclease